MSVFLPPIVTDCKGIVEGLACSPQQAMGRGKALGRTWRMIATALDGDFATARELATWMPAHGSSASIGHVLDSRGRPIDSIMWRANRLVDVLAKAAAAKHRLPAWAVQRVHAASRLVLHHAARLGKATHDANNFGSVDTDSNGDSVTKVLRDSTAARPWARHGRHRCEVSRAEPTPTDRRPGCGHMATPPQNSSERQLCRDYASGISRSRKRSAVEAAAKLWAEAQAEVGASRWIAALALRPSIGADAADRMSALRARIAQRRQSAATII